MMPTQVRLTCVDGSALRFPGAIPMMEGDTATVAIATASDKSASSIENIVSGVVNVPALGVDGVKDGVVAATAIGGTIKVREYLAVNPFLNEGTDYVDHILRDGESVTAEVIDANAKTLVVMGPA